MHIAQLFYISKFPAIFSVWNRLVESAGKFDLWNKRADPSGSIIVFPLEVILLVLNEAN